MSLQGLLLIGTKTLVLNSAMSGLATGYVIPKLKVSDLVTPVAHGRPGGVALGVPLLDDDDNRRQIKEHLGFSNVWPGYGICHSKAEG